MKNNKLKFDLGDTVIVRDGCGKKFIGIVSGISISKNGVEYSIRDRYGKYRESNLLVVK